MRGIYNGLQAKITEDNILAYYTPCSAHGLNLVGSNAAERCLEAAIFLNFFQSLYNFFSELTARWKIPQTFSTSKSISLKSLSTTR